MFKRNKLNPVNEAMALFNHVYSVTLTKTQQHNAAAEDASRACAAYLTAYKLVKDEVKNAKL